jgi:hypothetical protein
MRRSRYAFPGATQRIVHSSVCVGSGKPRQPKNGRFTLIWVLVLLLVILAIGGGIAISKFLFILLVLAVIVALVGARA